MNVSRRVFLKSGGVAMIGMSTIPAFLQRAVAATPMPNKKKLIVLFQRGAADGLNIVVPFGEAELLPHSPDHRDSAAAAGRRRRGGRSRRLLRPASEPRAARPAVSQRQLAIVHAAGSPDTTRSHFDAQDFMESGTPGVKATEDGWLNRTVQARAGAGCLAVPRRGHGAESSAHAARRRARDRACRREAVPRDEPVHRGAGRL